jgi:Protein of unknown function (DUF2934)
MKPSPIPRQNLANLEDEIRRRAYELYEQRGRVDGYALEDWLQQESFTSSLKSASETATFVTVQPRVIGLFSPLVWRDDIVPRGWAG